MAGAGLIGIKRRIKSVTNIKKITKAMGLVATAKLRKARVALEINNKYYETYKESVNYIVNSLEEKSIYSNGNGSNKSLYLILTSDSGLCGSFNINVVNKAIEKIQENKQNSKVIVLGQKGRGYLKRYKIESISEYVDLGDVPSIKEARTITNQVMDLYNSGEVGEVIIVYSKFYSPVKQEVQLEKVLPMPKRKVQFEGFMDFGNDSNWVLDTTVDNYVKASVLNFLYNSKASECGSRMTAMDGANENANELLDDLHVQFNRLRQSAITQEISEIVGGAEAQR